jgi:uncharacterized protein YjiS (DUF1127 family)
MRNVVPAFRYPSPDELQFHLARGRRLQSEALATGLATAGRQLSGALGASWRWLLGGTGRGAALWARLNAAQQRRRKQQRVHHELMDYSDQEHNDLGISRRDIPEIARAA